MFKNIKYSLKNKKAFTLIEIMIVIVIIGVLMAATMRFGGDRIGFLNNKNIKEQFVSSYDSIYSDNLMSSYYLGKIYKSLNVDFVVGNTGFDAKYTRYDDNLLIRDTYIDGGYYKINKLLLDGKVIDGARLSFLPYVLGCNISSDLSDENIDNDDINNDLDKDLDIEIYVNDSKKYCFRVKADTCRFSSVFCN